MGSMVLSIWRVTGRLAYPRRYIRLHTRHNCSRHCKWWANGICILQTAGNDEQFCLLLTPTFLVRQDRMSRPMTCEMRRVWPILVFQTPSSACYSTSHQPPSSVHSSSSIHPISLQGGYNQPWCPQIVTLSLK